MIKKINTHGITFLELLDGSFEWYWGCDYAHGGLYEAEELYCNGSFIKCNRLVFVRYPDGCVVEPIKEEAGQYFGQPIFYNGKIHILLVNFLMSQIFIFQYNENTNQIIKVASISLTEVENCYNLMLHQSSLMLTRQAAHDGKFQIIWPEKIEFNIEKSESFLYRKGNKLYFCRWYEEPNYREEMIIRKYSTGEVLKIVPGTWMNMPDGQIWVLC